MQFYLNVMLIIWCSSLDVRTAQVANCVPSEETGVGPWVCSVIWLFICTTRSNRSHRTLQSVQLAGANPYRWCLHTLTDASHTLAQTLNPLLHIAPPSMALCFCPPTRFRSHPVAWCRSSTAARLVDPTDISLSTPSNSIVFTPPAGSVEWSSTACVRLRTAHGCSALLPHARPPDLGSCHQSGAASCHRYRHAAVLPHLIPFRRLGQVQTVRQYRLYIEMVATGEFRELSFYAAPDCVAHRMAIWLSMSATLVLLILLPWAATAFPQAWRNPSSMAGMPASASASLKSTSLTGSPKCHRASGLWP